MALVVSVCPRSEVLAENQRTDLLEEGKEAEGAEAINLMIDCDENHDAQLDFLLVAGRTKGLLLQGSLVARRNGCAVTPVYLIINICDISGTTSSRIEYKEPTQDYYKIIFGTVKNSLNPGMVPCTVNLGPHFFDSCIRRLKIDAKAEFKMSVMVPYQAVGFDEKIEAKQVWLQSDFIHIKEGKKTGF